MATSKFLNSTKLGTMKTTKSVLEIGSIYMVVINWSPLVFDEANISFKPIILRFFGLHQLNVFVKVRLNRLTSSLLVGVQKKFR